MEKKQRKIDKKAFIEWFLVIITGIIINFLCVLIFSITSHAESNYFPMQQNENGNIPQYIIDYFNDNYAEDYYIVLRWWGHNASFNEDYIYFLMFPKTNDFMVYGEILNNGYQFSLYNSGNQIGGLSNGHMGFRNGSQSDYWNGGQNITGWQVLNSSLYDNSTDFVSNFKIWTNSNEDNRDVVLRYGSDEEIIDVGHATHPHFDGLHPHYGNTVNPPDEVPPTYTINNYSWTTYNNPPVDNSSTDALLESIFDILSYNAGYLQTNISNEFDNLILNIKGLVDYMGETLQYYGDLIIANIQNGIQNFYDNMVSLVEPIHDKISALQEKVEEVADLFINPFDEEEFDEQIENSSFFTNYNAIIDNCEEISEIFDYAEERDHFSLYISFENPFADSEHKIIASEINFDWLVPLRSVYRPFIWVCVLIELFVGGARVLTRIIGGHGI